MIESLSDSRGVMLKAASIPVAPFDAPGHVADILTRDLNLGFRASGTTVASVAENAFIVLGSCGLFRDHDVANAMQGWIAANQHSVSNGIYRWHQVSIAARPADLFVASFKLSANDDICIASLFEHPIDPIEKTDVETNYLQRIALAKSYLQIAILNRSRREREIALEAALSTMRTGVVLLDEQANVVFSNAAAGSMFEAADCLKLHRGRLLTTSIRDNVRLTVALQHAVAQAETPEIDQRVPLLAIERSDHSSLILLALALPPATISHGGAATILHIVDPKVDFADHVRPLCRLYQLSRTETDLACLLAKGLTLARAADIMHLREQTARSSLRSIFYKTGTGRQTELVLLLLSRVLPTVSALKIEAF